MSRRGSRLSLLTAFGLCLLALASALALAAPARRSAHHHGAPAGARCTQGSHRARHARRGTRRKVSRCPRATHRSTRHVAAPPPPSAGASGGTPPANGPGTPPAGPAPTSPGPIPPTSTAPGETPPPPHGPPAVPRVQVTAVEYHFTLSRTTVPAGNVIFEFVNHGQDEHNLNVAPPTGPLAGSFANTASEGVANLEVDLRPGTYTLFCSLPEHEQKGMKATLVVE